MIAVEFISYGLKNQLAIGNGGEKRGEKKENRVRTGIEKEIRKIREKSESEKEKRENGENQRRTEKRDEKKRKGGQK